MGFLVAANNSDGLLKRGQGFQAAGPDDGQRDSAFNNANNSYQNQVDFASSLNPNANVGLGNQATLAQMLLAQSQGQGPNPAQLQYNQNINNIANQQAGAIGSVKGISPALAAQLISQQGGQAMQGGAANSAILQAQQQLAAQQGLMDLSNQMVQQKQAANQAQVSAALGQQQNLYGLQGNANTVNAGTAAQSQKQRWELGQGLAQGAASAGAKAAGAWSGGVAGQNKMYTVADALMQGGKVPGQAPVAGDSPKNDIVHAMLSPGEVVIPRSLVENPEAAKKFIEHIQKKYKGGKVGYGDVLKSRRAC